MGSAGRNRGTRPIRQHNFVNNRIATKRTKAGTNSKFAVLNNVKSLNVAIAVNNRIIFIDRFSLLNESETRPQLMSSCVFW